VLLAISAEELSTPRVYAKFDETKSTVRPSSPTDAADLAFRGGLTGADLADLTTYLADANDLWPAAAALMPSLVERRAALEAQSGIRWLMSGSGPTLFALYATVAAATAAGRRLAAGGSSALRDVMLCATDLHNPNNTWRN
jgi:4-diphosphocytidyl-2-C-methyl-D-erythritol kinase